MIAPPPGESLSALSGSRSRAPASSPLVQSVKRDKEIYELKTHYTCSSILTLIYIVRVSKFGNNPAKSDCPANGNEFKKIKNLNSAITTRIHFYPIKM